MRWLLNHAFCVAALLTLVLEIPRTACAQGDGRRTVKSERYGIVTRVPAAWRLIDWSRDDKAFVLKLPQDPGSISGYVGCELGVAPETLDDFRKEIDAGAKTSLAQLAEDQPVRTLVSNRIEKLDPGRHGETLAKQLGERLVSAWETIDTENVRTFELYVRVVHDGTLYTFSLASDEAHYDAYRLDFEDMLTACVFSPPETGLQKMSGGYWMQRDFRFALKLPDGWRPAFGPEDQVLFFATGETHQLFRDNLIVLATARQVQDLEKLKSELPDAVAKHDPAARVTTKIVPQGGTAALETVIETRRGGLALTILERRFTTEQRNYEVKITCLSSVFAARQEEFRKTLDSFAEVLAAIQRLDA